MKTYLAKHNLADAIGEHKSNEIYDYVDEAGFQHIKRWTFLTKADSGIDESSINIDYSKVIKIMPVYLYTQA